jgi:uncharacterized protein YpmB
MMKTIYLILVVMVLFSLFFGCTRAPVSDNNSNAIKLNTQEEVDLTTSDVSTDISGINATLDEIDSALSE